MSGDADRERQIFFEVHRELPREAPGNRASTARALDIVTHRLPADHILQLLDVGCGPGQQTVELAYLLPRTRILATDLHHPFLREARRRLAAAGAAARATVVRADMRRLPLASASIDLVWCEGAAYIMGVGEALSAWRVLLRPGGCAAFTEAVWLRDDPPSDARAFWTEYPAMGDIPAVLEIVEASGFEALETFVLPSAAWWDDYYGPMQDRVDALSVSYRNDPVAQRVLRACRQEIDVFRQHGDCYGYAFFTAAVRPPGSGLRARRG